MANGENLYRFEVRTRGAGSPRIEALKADVRALGMGILRSARDTALYFVEGDLAPEELCLLGRFLLSDPVEETFEWREVSRQALHGSISEPDTVRIVEICRKPGVTDTVANELVRAAREMGIPCLNKAATGIRWELEADWLNETSLLKLTRVLLANSLIDRWEFGEINPIFPEGQLLVPPVEQYDLGIMDDDSLLSLSSERRLALDLTEMKAIQAWFVAQRREITDVELEMIAQTWSEHCVHKSFKADIEVIRDSKPSDRESAFPRIIHSIFNTYIKNTTEEIGAPWVKSAFVDNAGIVSFDDRWDLSFKVETHNHPSAIEPFGGANTGVGGVIRDIMGVSAKPIAVTDILCFGPPDISEDELPQGTLHPRLVARGVVAGVEDYGNKMGIPTVNGAVHFHPGYAANPLVYCGCIGLAPRGIHRNKPESGDHVIVLGGRTGRDGIRGATFSSMKMDGSTGEVAGASVQIGDPIIQKKALDVLLAARDAGLYNAVTDCGAGGLSSAVGEMARELGAEIDLSGLGTKYPGLAPWELWLSEAQERMVLAIPPRHIKAFSELCSIFECEFWDIGAFRSDGELKVRVKGELVLDLSMIFLHQGLPKKLLIAKEPLSKSPQERLQKSIEANVYQARLDTLGIQTTEASNVHSELQGPDENRQASPGLIELKEQLLKLLGSREIASREKIVRRYDHEVQGNSVIKPFVGAFCDSPSDAAVLKPKGAACEWGIALSNGFRSDYGELDPYRGAWAAVDEAMRNIVASGGDPSRTAILDNFCMGDPNDPGVMWSLLESARGLREAALAFHTPIISGKDSFYNEYLGADGSRHAVPPSLLISALAYVPKVERVVTTFFKHPADSIWLVGDFKPSAIWQEEVPEISLRAQEVYSSLFDAIQEGEVLAAHDLSEGGLAVALAEMCIGGRLGARIALSDIYEQRNIPISQTTETDNAILGVLRLALFGETMGCLLVEVGAGKEEQFAARFAPNSSKTSLQQNNLAKRIGEVLKEPSLEIVDPFLFLVSIGEMLDAWKTASQELLP